MKNRHMRTDSTLYDIRKMKIKITIRYHYTYIKWPKSRALTTQNAGKMWKNRKSHSLLVGRQNGTSMLTVITFIQHSTRGLSQNN